MVTRTKALLAFGALFAAAFAYACTLNDITGVPVGMVTIQPPSATILEGATVQLSAQAQDQMGDPLPIGSIVWSIADPSVISISQSGLVQALSAGQTTVRATLEGVSATALVTVVPRPTIAVDPASISFLGAVGPTPPDPVDVDIENVGGGQLGGLSASVQYGGEASGWLSLSLSGTTAPTTLRVSVLSGGLQEGTYSATVSLSAQGAGNSPLTIPVELRLTLTDPVISLIPQVLEFEVVEGDGPPPPEAVEVTNGGGGALTGLEALVPPGSWLSASLSSTDAPAQLSVEPDPTGLAIGTYQERVLVRSEVALNQEEVEVTLRIVAPD
ncbi:MAG: Ig-like domain-containing protein, partial [Gemmatimonadetes bacterium]|nr:Ig-like domain-containing protein [Gemmatimonadota bacterium]